MTSYRVPIPDRAAARDFDAVLVRASTVSRDMIEVHTSICGDAVVKTVRTRCPLALAVIGAAGCKDADHG